MQRRDAHRVTESERVERRHVALVGLESILFTTTSTGTSARRSRRASVASSSTSLVRPSTTNRTTSAASAARSAWRETSLDPGRALAVSAGVHEPEGSALHVASSSTRSRRRRASRRRSPPAARTGGSPGSTCPRSGGRPRLRPARSRRDRARTSSSARRTTSGAASPVVSSTTASGAGSSGFVRASSSSRSRAPPRSAKGRPHVRARRSARSTGFASRKILSGGAGATTVPMSRPSITAPSAASRRCSARSTSRTSG